MIKLRVEWRQTCPSCGVQLVFDYLADADGNKLCPWCGHVHDAVELATDGELKSFLNKSMSKLESKANRFVADSG
jgi:hypothetical protein